MTVSYALQVPCKNCGHPRAHHDRSDEKGCNHELKDHDGSFIRCGCWKFDPSAERLEPKGGFL